MATFCTSCGHELRDSDKFCAECGTAVGAPGAAQAQRAVYETYRIKFRLLGKSLGFGILPSRMEFFAEAIGPHGTYEAGLSAKFGGMENYPVNGMRSHRNALDGLIKGLTSQGWESQGPHGDNWWNYDFRRPVMG
jgi:hypothetical protein